jgi:hypothetical protein
VTDKTSPAALIKQYYDVEAFLKEQTEAFEKWAKPHRDRIEEIKTQLHEQLVALNAGSSEGKRASLATEHGTAYLSTIVTPKVTNREAWLDWILEQWDERGAMLAIGTPVKDAFNEYRDKHEGALPPNVEVSSFTRVNIRKS